MQRISGSYAGFLLIGQSCGGPKIGTADRKDRQAPIDKLREHGQTFGPMLAFDLPGSQLQYQCARKLGDDPVADEEITWLLGGQPVLGGFGVSLIAEGGHENAGIQITGAESQ
jgi:hypothetical protein